MVDGLNFKDFVAFLSAFSARASMQQKCERKFFFWHTEFNISGWTASFYDSEMYLVYFEFNLDNVFLRSE